MFATRKQILLLMLLPATIPFAPAQQPISRLIERETLRDIGSVAVEVENLHRDARRDGLQREDLEEMVRSRLQEAGIGLVEETRDPEQPYLYVNLNTVKTGQVHLYGLSLSLLQSVQLSSRPEAVLAAATWESGCLVGALEVGKLSGIRNVLIQVVDLFVEDYLAVNNP